MDTNFLMMPAQFRVDIFEEMERVLNMRVEAVVPSPVYEEVQRLAEGRGEERRRRAKVAMRLMERAHVLEVERLPEETIDDLITRLAREWNCPVATNDVGLRRRLRDISVPVIYLRQRSHLAVEGVVP